MGAGAGKKKGKVATNDSAAGHFSMISFIMGVLMLPVCFAVVLLLPGGGGGKKNLKPLLLLVFLLRRSKSLFACRSSA